MDITPHDIPLFEYDPDPQGLIRPDHDRPDEPLPKKAVFAFLGDEIDRFAQERGARVIGRFESATKTYPAYLLQTEKEPVCLMQAPVGAPAAVQLLEWLIFHGAREIVSTGSCGALVPLGEGQFLVPYRALRDEGTSYHYLEPSRFITLSLRAREAIETVLRRRGLPFSEAVTWTTDAFFRETRAKTALRREEGCVCVEMECAALAACARLRGITWGELLFTADTLANADRYDPRGWGKEAAGPALELCLEAVQEL